jgi:hypothetical protein
VGNLSVRTVEDRSGVAGSYYLSATNTWTDTSLTLQTLPPETSGNARQLS